MGDAGLLPRAEPLPAAAEEAVWGDPSPLSGWLKLSHQDEQQHFWQRSELPAAS